MNLQSRDLFYVGWFILIGVLFCLDRKYRVKRPPATTFVTESIVAYIHVWCWPYGEKWKTYLPEEKHSLFYGYRKYSRIIFVPTMILIGLFAFAELNDW